MNDTITTNTTRSLRVLWATVIAILVGLTVTAGAAEASTQYKFVGNGWAFEVDNTNCNTWQRRLETKIDLAAPANWDVAIRQDVYQKKSTWTKISSDSDWLYYGTDYRGRLNARPSFGTVSSGYDYHVAVRVAIRKGPGYSWIPADDAYYALRYLQNGSPVEHPWACRI